MKRCLFICISFLFTNNLVFSTDQIHDILIVGRDTIFLKTFPLEELNLTIRPFQYGRYDFPGTSCYRGYQATWKVIDKRLFLVEIAKVDDTHEKADIIQLFAQNGLSPTVINGMILADWFSIELTSFPRVYKFLGCVWKSSGAKKCRPTMRFDSGRLVYNRYSGRF